MSCTRNARSGEFVTPVTRCAGSRWRGLQICSGAGTNRTAWAVAIEHQERQEWGVCYPGTVAKLAMRQPFVLFKGLTFQKLCLPGAFRPGDHHNKMLRPGLCVVHASPQYL